MFITLLITVETIQKNKYFSKHRGKKTNPGPLRARPGAELGALPQACKKSRFRKFTLSGGGVPKSYRTLGRLVQADAERVVAAVAPIAKHHLVLEEENTVIRSSLPLSQ